MTPIWDEAERTVVAVNYDIDVRWPINGLGSPLDVTMDGYKTSLMTPAQTLVYENKGFGDYVTVGPNGPLYDTNFGPKPRYCEFEAIGNQGAILKWGVSFRIPYCASSSVPGATYKPKIMAANYELTYDIDQDGLTTLTTSGYVEIPLTRYAVGAAGRQILTSADSFRSQIRPTVPAGFQRMSQRFHLSKDKRRLDFTFVDKELFFPLPAGTTACDVDHTIEGGMMDGGFQKWTGTFSGTVTTAVGTSKASAFDKFMLVVSSRLKQNVGNPPIPPRVVAGKNAPSTTVLLTGLTIRDSVFKRTTQFTVRYWIFACSLDKILSVSGLWTPVPGTDFNSWKGSLDASVWRVRGNAGLAFGSTEDVIVDLCASSNKAPAGNPTPQTQPTPTSPASESAASGATEPTAIGSWGHFEMSATARHKARQVRHKPLNGAAGVSTAAPALNAFGDAQSGAVGIPGAPETWSVPDITQRVSAPSFFLNLRGMSVRLGKPTPIPGVTAVGGQPVVLAEQVYDHQQIGSVAGMPLILTRWDIDYIVKLPPSMVPVPTNPQFAVNDIATSSPSMGVADMQTGSTSTG